MHEARSIHIITVSGRLRPAVAQGVAAASRCGLLPDDWQELLPSHTHQRRSEAPGRRLPRSRLSSPQPHQGVFRHSQGLCHQHARRPRLVTPKPESRMDRREDDPPTTSFTPRVLSVMEVLPSTSSASRCSSPCTIPRPTLPTWGSSTVFTASWHSAWSAISSSSAIASRPVSSHATTSSKSTSMNHASASTPTCSRPSPLLWTSTAIYSSSAASTPTKASSISAKPWSK